MIYPLATKYIPDRESKKFEKFTIPQQDIGSLTLKEKTHDNLSWSSHHLCFWRIRRFF